MSVVSLYACRCYLNGGLCYLMPRSPFVPLLLCVLFGYYGIDGDERLPITTTLAADVASSSSSSSSAAAAAAAAALTCRCLFVLTPPAPRNFNKSLSKTSTFALGLRGVSRGDDGRFETLFSRPSDEHADDDAAAAAAVTKLFF